MLDEIPDHKKIFWVLSKDIKKAQMLKRILALIATVIFGFILALLLLEIGLWLVPDAIWKGWISKNPTRYLLYQTDKNIGWIHLPNAETNWQGFGEFNVDVKINSLGLRDYERSYTKPANTFRILVLGDSFAEAIQLPLAQIFPVQLENCLTGKTGRPIEVINSGVSSYSPADELLFFTREGVKYQPDLVLVSLYAANDVIKDMGRDIDDNMVQSFGGYRFYLDKEQLKQRWIDWANPPDEQISPLERFLRRYSGLYYIFESPDSRVSREIDKLVERWWPKSPSSSPIAKASEKVDWPDYTYDEYLIIFAKNFPDNPLVPPSIKQLWQLFKVVVQKLQAEVDAQNAQLAVVIIPAGAQVHQKLYETWVSEFTKRYNLLGTRDVWDVNAPDKAISNFMAEQNIPTLDLLPGFQAYAQTHDDLLYFERDIHFNEKGHQLAANLICDWLVDQELIPLQ